LGRRSTGEKKIQIESNSDITSSNRPHSCVVTKECRSEQRCVVQVNENYFKTKYSPAGLVPKYLRYDLFEN